MRRHVVFMLVVLLSAAALASAQEDETDVTGSESRPITVEHMIAGEWQPLALEAVDEVEVPLGLRAPSASDSCSAAPDLGLPDGGSTVVNGMDSIDSSDPVLSCMWGTPSRDQGYRTVWYKLTPTETTLAMIDTRGSNYDTVLAVYDSGGRTDCSNLIQIACNDDFDYFSSWVSFPVRSGHIYYVEVADWRQSLNGTAILNLQSGTAPLESNWNSVSQMDVPRSRHVAVVVGNQLYVIAGQIVTGVNPERTRRVDRYDTESGQWTPRAHMAADESGLGYSNTTAAYVDGVIYVPSGFTGAADNYVGTHWAYNISQDAWSEAPENPFWAENGGPTIFSAAVPYNGTLDNAPFEGYFLLGGLASVPDLHARSEVYTYNVLESDPSKRWSEPPIAGWEYRFGHVAAEQKINGKDFICVAGGVHYETAETMKSVQCLDPTDGVWMDMASLNYPRYFPGSAVDPEGNWYVFGGFDEGDKAVGIIERYDRNRDKWITMDIRFDLENPTRAWARGGFVGQTLWVTGGEASGFQALTLIDSVELPWIPYVQPSLLLPIISTGESLMATDNNFAGAQPLKLNQPLQDSFVLAEDNTNVYVFETSSRKKVTIDLAGIQLGSDYNLHVYTKNKQWLDSSENIGASDEKVTITVDPEPTYVVVFRKQPPIPIDPDPSPYTISVK